MSQRHNSCHLAPIPPYHTHTHTHTRILSLQTLNSLILNWLAICTNMRPQSTFSDCAFDWILTGRGRSGQKNGARADANGARDRNVARAPPVLRLASGGFCGLLILPLSVLPYHVPNKCK